MANDQWGKLFERLDRIDETLADHGEQLGHVKGTLADHSEQLGHVKTTLAEHGEQLEGIAGQLKKLTDDKPFSDKRISRLEYRTEKALGKKLGTVDADFEKRYASRRR